MSWYPCRMVHECGQCRSSASYFAVDNRAQYGHLCRQCWLVCPDRTLYSDRTENP